MKQKVKILNENFQMKKKKLNQKREILSEICGCVGLAPTTSNFIFKQKQKKLVKKDDPNIFIN